MKSYDIPFQVCPHCGAKFDQTTGVMHNELPEPGCISLCVRCGTPGIFQDDLTVRKPTGEELLEINLRPDVIEGQIFLAGLRKKYARRNKQD